MDIKNVSVIGAGIMGHGIARVSAMNGYHAMRTNKREKIRER